MPFALITRLLTGEAGIYFARLRAMIAWYAIMGVLLLVMLIFIVVALFSWAAGHWGTPITGLVFAGVFLALSLIAFIVARLVGRAPRSPREDRLRQDIASIAGVTAISNAPQLFRLVQRKRGLLIVPAIAAGFFGLYKAIAAIRER